MKHLSLALAATALLSSAAFAQTGPALDAPVEDEVISEGTLKGVDPAMSAFLAGDYVTAEIEFERNFSTLKRIESNRRASIEQNATDAISGQVFANANTGSGASAESAAAGDSNTIASPILYTNKRDVRQGPGEVSSGNDIGTQLYMAGLSELKQGKLDEARVSLKRALNFNKTLHDARYRLALISLGTGEPGEARKQLARLERALESCYTRCEALGDRPILESSIADLRRFMENS